MGRSAARGAQTVSVQDELENMVGQLDGSHSITQQVTYDPWGAPTVVAGSSPNRLWWKGLLWDETTGLYYMRNRWYDPQTGRFISEDPIGIDGDINLYQFGNGDPVNYADPFGLCPDPTKPWCTSPLYRTLQFFGVNDATADRWAGIAYGGAMGAGALGVGMAVRGTARLLTTRRLSPVPGSDWQFGSKFGEHRNANIVNANIVGYRTHQEYRQLANEIYNDPKSIRTIVPWNAPVHAGEIHYRRGGDLLRLDPQGNFRSLYPDPW